LTFAFARSYPNSSMTGELLLDLSEMHLGRGDSAACFAILDSLSVFGDNDHVAEAFNRTAQLYLESQKKPASARYAILRYLSRFPYDPRSLDLLGRFVDTLWKKQDLAEAQDVLLQATKLTAPNARLEAIVFRHAQRLQSVAGRFTQAIDWYLYLADQYPGGTYRTRALDSATRCVIRSGLHRHENYSHRINDFLHPDGLKR
jgi:tetratricopeptide (TPR) repeat protein